MTKDLFIRRIIWLILATILDIVVITVRWTAGGNVLILMGAYLWYVTILYLILLIIIACMLFNVRKRKNGKEKTIFTWALIILLAPVLSVCLSHCQRFSRRFYKLPNDDTVTVWGNQAIFEKYWSPFRPKTNYIEVPNIGYWGFAIDTQDSLIIEYYSSEKVTICSPKYPVRDICDGESFLEKHPYEELKAKYEYSYMVDGLVGIGSSGNIEYITLTDEEVSVSRWEFDFAEMHFHLSDSYTIPRDSFLLSQQK